MPRDLSDLEGVRLTRYLSGECTPEELAEIERWVAEAPERKLLVNEFRSTMNAVPSRSNEWDVAAAWRHTVARRKIATRPVGQVRAQAARPNYWLGGLVAAATIVGVAIVATVSSHVRWPGAQPTHEYATGAGQRLFVTLLDGTRVTLAPESRMRLAPDYRTGDRRVFLTGEAYFTVVHDTRHPFAVQASGVVAQDVGTAFDVRAYPEDLGARVAVADGVVDVERADCQSGPVVCESEVRRGDVVTLSETSVEMRHQVDVGRLTMWLQGGFAFEDTPLRDVVRQIGRTFGVKITLADSTLAAKPVTATFVGDSLDFVLNAVTGVVGAGYERHGNHIVIRKGPVRPARDDAPHLPLRTAEGGTVNE